MQLGNNYNELVDVYSLGRMYLELLGGRDLLNNDKNSENFRRFKAYYCKLRMA